jgi:histidyl-tRNA synthetase
MDVVATALCRRASRRAPRHSEAATAFIDSERERSLTFMQSLPGFRDFLPERCAARNYIFARWREVARRYAFVEWEGPLLEPTELYKKKSGAEIVDQLFNFTDKGEREVALRPELTPTLARIVAAHEREFKKPLKWFSIGQFFRYEKQQRGRLREHFQLNCDIIGEASVAAEAELIALLVDLLREFGFTKEDFVVRISSRDVWRSFLLEKLNPGKPTSSINDAPFRRFLEALDKIDRQDDRTTNDQLREFGSTVTDVWSWVEKTRRILEEPRHDESLSLHGTTLYNLHNLFHDHLIPRGLKPYVEIDLSIVRGLAYYTGIVFEVFSRKTRLRAVAGGGRYDDLIKQLSDSAVSMPALGFAMGDVVLGELINETPHAREAMEKAIANDQKIDIYIVIAKEERRNDALVQIQELRDRGYRVDYPLTSEKVGKQFQTAEQLGARVAVLFGDEWPQLKIKNMATAEQELVQHDHLLAHLQALPSLSS